MSFLRSSISSRCDGPQKWSIKLSSLVQFLFQANKLASRKHSLTFSTDCKGFEAATKPHMRSQNASQGDGSLAFGRTPGKA